MEKFFKGRALFNSKHPPVNDAQTDGSSVFKPRNGNISKKLNNPDSKSTNMKSIFFDSQFKEDHDSPRIDKVQEHPKKQESTSSSEKYTNFVTLNVDIGVAIGYAIFYILILGSDINYLALHKVAKITIGTISYVQCIIAIKSIILALHSLLYVVLYKVKGLRRRFYRHFFYWELFMIIVATHLSSIQEYNFKEDGLENDETHESSQRVETLLLQIYNVWGLYLLLPVSILKNEVRMRPNQKQMRYTTIVIICLMIKLYPGYLIISDSPETLFKASFLSRIIIIDIIHCIVVYVIRSMLFQIQSLKEEQELQSKSTIKEVKNLLKKMPEGILIMPDKQCQDCYMNQELTFFLSSIGIQKGSCCSPDADLKPLEKVPEDYNIEESFSALQKKMFKIYKQKEDQLIGDKPSKQDEDYQMQKSLKAKRSSIKRPDRSAHIEDLFSLRDIIDITDWNEDEEWFFEIIMPQIPQEDKEEEKGVSIENPLIQQTQEDRVFVQIRRLSVEYLQQTAKMIVIRDISLIIEFEKEKNENKYQELLTATMSHEMLTPLNSIINLSMYLEQKLSSRQQREDQHTISDGSRGGSNEKVEIKQSIGFLNIIKSSANILQFLIKDMIDLMNLRLDKFNQQTVVFSAIDACNEILQYYEFQAREKGLYLKRKINHDARSKIKKLAGDKQRYMQILLNIVQNSVKFTYQGGVNIILDFQPNYMIGGSHSSIKSPKNKMVRIQKNQNSGCLDCGNLVTIIKDTGIGIPKTNVERLFKIFGNVNRGQHSSLITTQGIGLGLTICKQLVEKLGGQINLSSLPNIGTDVQFSLPAKCVECFKHQMSEQTINSRHCSSLTFNLLNRADAISNNALQGQPKKNVPHQVVVPCYNDFNGSFTSYTNFHNNTTNLIHHRESNSINKDLSPPSYQRGIGNSQEEQKNKTFNKSLTCNTPLTPQVKRFKRRPFGGDISIATNLNGINRMVYQMVEPYDQSRPQNEWKNEEQFGDSLKTDINQRQQLENEIVRANESEEQKIGQLLYNNSNLRTQSISNKSNVMPMGSIKSKFANKSGHPPTNPNDSSYPIRPSIEESKSRCITDSRNGMVVASEFLTSSHVSIQDKLMKQPFATKILNKNNQIPNSIFNKKGFYSQSGIKEEREPSMEGSQDIRKLLESSNMSVNDESSYIEMPFYSNQKINFSGHSPQRKSPQYQEGPCKIERFSIRGLDPYTEKITNKNDLKAVNIQNQDQSFAKVNKILLEDQFSGGGQHDPDDAKENSQQQEKVFSVVTLQPCKNSSSTQNNNNNNNQDLTINYGAHNKYSSQLVKSQLSSEQITVQNLAFQDQSWRIVDTKNQTGFFPTQQKTNFNQNHKLIISEHQMKSKITSLEEVELNIDLNHNQGLSCAAIAVDQNSKSSKQKHQKIMSSADITPQFNPLFKAGCAALIINSTERGLYADASMNEIKNNGNNLIIQNDKQDVMNQRSLRDMPFQPRLVTQDTKGYEKSSNNDHYQAIATFSLNPQPASSSSKIKMINQFKVQGQGLEHKKSKQFSTLEEEEEPVLESRAHLTNQGMNQQFNQQDQREESKYHDESGKSKESEIKINLKEIQPVESNNQISPQKNSNNTSYNINHYSNSNNYSNTPIKKNCSCESTVLIVDDNFFNLIPLQLILRETFGIKTDKALNGQEAVVKFCRYNLQKDCQCGIRYKLVLMDLNMPIMDGYKASTEILRMQKLYMEQEKKQSQIEPKNAGSGESCQTISHAAKNNSLFIVAVTAFVNEENISHCFASGMSDVIHKPVSQESIKQVLDKFYYQKEPIQLQMN